MTSRNNTRLIEKYISGNLSLADKIILESKLAIDPVLKQEFYFQKKTYQLVKYYHREKVKEELDALHKKIFSHPNKINFRRSIYRLFKK
jgi:hypothetical protein